MTTLYDPEAYDAISQGVPGDVEFFVRLAGESRDAGLPVLELACGTGRVTIPIARAGVSVVGLDASSAMLGRAREKGAGLSNVRWVEGDMREFDLAERFGLVCIPARSFQHLLTVEDQLACLTCIRHHLAAGGRLAVNIFNPDIVRIANWLTTRKGTLQFLHEGGGWKRWETADYATDRQALDVTFLDEQVDEGGVVKSRVYRGLKLRYTFRYEMEHLFARAGFEVQALYGDFFGNEFTGTSPEMVWLARPSL